MSLVKRTFEFSKKRVQLVLSVVKKQRTSCSVSHSEETEPGGLPTNHSMTVVPIGLPFSTMRLSCLPCLDTKRHVSSQKRSAVSSAKKKDQVFSVSPRRDRAWQFADKPFDDGGLDWPTILNDAAVLLPMSLVKRHVSSRKEDYGLVCLR